MSLSTHTQSYLFSSDPANGSLNLSADGHSFDVQLDQPIHVPRTAENCSIRVLQSSVWYTTPNISAEKKNNTLDIFSLWEDPVSGAPPNSPNFQIVFDDGLYSLSALNAALARELQNLGLPATLIVISGDDATQRSILTFNNDGFQTYADFTQPDSIRTILGFNARQSPPAPDQSTPGFSDQSDSIAEFNQLNAYLISSDLTAAGVPVNNQQTGVLCQIPINSPPGTQLNFEPFNPVKVNATGLIGLSRNQINFRLLDQRGIAVNTNGEYYSLLLEITYDVPYGRHVGQQHDQRYQHP